MGRKPNPIPHERRLISLPVEAWARLEVEAKAAGVPLTALVAGKILGYPDEYRPAVTAPPAPLPMRLRMGTRAPSPGRPYALE